jgi:hypothetical protein
MRENLVRRNDNQVLKKWRFVGSIALLEKDPNSRNDRRNCCTIGIVGSSQWK